MNDPSQEHNQLQASQRVLSALRQARARLEAAERVWTEPIAVVGVGCRFPGGDGPRAFWEALRNGVDAVREMPAERFELDDWTGAEAAEGTATRRGTFLDHIDRFDAEFFGISPREAAGLDPQQRLLLEVTWEALEHAGQAPDSLAGSRTGVFLGVSQNDYALLQIQQRDPRKMDFYVGTGGGLCYGAGRLSHVLGLRGPNMAVDTACSSSLLTVHLACQSLRLRECDLALAGGVHLAISRRIWDLLATTGALSPDGRCRAFDAAANGFGRGEGCGIVVLRRLGDALDHRDQILAVIRGSAINHDGASSGLTVPNERSQEELLRRALDAARLEPAAVDYVEAHGTGTTLGDPIEAGALASVFGPGRPREAPLLVGSVKSNLGHLEAAAGIAGLIKVVLSLMHEQIPPHLHCRAPSQHIPWDQIPVAVAADAVPWRRGTRPRIAGVSSFGMSGANAHVLLEEAPSIPAGQRPADRRRPRLLTLSARTPAALRQSAARMDQWLADNPSVDLADVAFTGSAGRAHFDVRTSFVVDSIDAARQALASITAGRVAPGAIDAESAAPKVALLFSGPGSQLARTGLQLYETQPDFRRAIESCDACFKTISGASLLSVFDPPEGQADLMRQPANAQPALFALETALAGLLRGWGIHPGAVMGYSVGEYAAAAVAGVFSLEDGFRLVAEQARLMQSITQPGAMATVLADEEAVRCAVRPLSSDVSIAAVNGPRDIVISGNPASVQSLVEAFERDGIRAERLPDSPAFHSSAVEPVLAAVEQFAGHVTCSQPAIDLISGATARLATSEVIDPRYWSRHARQTVLFSASLTALYESGYRIFVECGPRPTLCSLARHCLPDDAVLLPCLSDEREDWRQLLETLGRLYEQGVAIDWEAVYRDEAPRRLALPTYPFQRERYWFAAAGDAAGKPASRRAASAADADPEAEPRPDGPCRYELNWQPRELAEADSDRQLRAGDTWLIFADRTGVAGRLQEMLEARNQECLLVYPGERFARLTPRQWSVDPTAADDFRRLLDDCAADRPLKAVVHLSSLDAADADALTAGSLDAAQRFGFAAALHLTQAMVQRECTTPLWLITRQAAVVAGDRAPAAGLAQSPLWGLGKVIALEHPEIWGGLIDLPAEPDADSLETLVGQVCAGDFEDQTAIRDGRRYVARLGRGPQPDGAAGEILPAATYLITGGLGNLGLHVARWLVDQGARHLVLASRSAPGEAAKATIHALQQAGAKVLVAQADVTSEQQVAGVLQQIHNGLPPLRGVIHAAGAYGYRSLAELDWETACAVLRPKVRGTWVLHQATRDIALDFFVGFSSLASLWGSKGQAHYAAANGFLDALAHRRRGIGMAGTSVNWGPWSGGGMATDEALALLERSGVKALAPPRALELLGRLLTSASPQTALAAVDWPVFKALFEAKRRRPLLDEMPACSIADGPAATRGEGQAEIERRLEGLSAEQARRELVAWIQSEVAVVLHLANGKLPDPHKGFFKLGMDSLMAVELAKRLQQGTRRALPSTIAFDFSNVNQLAEHLAAELLPAGCRPHDGLPAENAAQDPPRTTDETSTNSNGNSGATSDDIDRWLAEKLARLESLIGEP